MLTGLLGTLLISSVVVNLYLGIIVASLTGGPSEAVYRPGDHDHRIVILPISGMIDSGTSSFVHDALKSLREDPPKAIVLRVNSGGGGVTASDQILHELKMYVEETEVPVVASFGAMAASGGYYVSMNADHIFAEPTTITGSIGVIAQAFTLHELLEKIGVKPEIIAATKATEKDKLNPMRPWTDKDRATLRSILDNAYDQFVKIVDQGREGLDMKRVLELATGDIFTASQALENGLIDSVDYLDAAIDKAKELAGIAQEIDPEVSILKPAQGFGFGRGGFSAATLDPDNLSGAQIRRWLSELSIPQAEYLITR